MACLDVQRMQDLVAGTLAASVRAQAMEHVDGCGDCKRALAALAAHDLALDATLAPVEGGLAETLDSVPAAPMRIRAPDAVGKQLGRYQVVERLGAGAMGVVYRAQDRELDRAVALKLLHRPEATLTDRLVREARAMAQVNHPNVVAVYDVGETDGVTYIAMELVTGESLRAWTEAARVIVDAGRGLAAAHAAGIVHRDFKPDNVLVGNDGRVRVSDFGLAESHARQAPGDDAVMGTPAYMAPEQFAGRNVDARTDQFNFCASLYEALYDERPFAGQSFTELAELVTEGRVRPAPSGSTISPALRAIVMRGLSPRPGDRFPTMEALIVQLGRDRATPWRVTSRVAAVLAAMLALGLVADAVVRDRVAGNIAEAFAATARQTDRAVHLLAGRFDAMSNQVYTFEVMRDVTGHYERAEFGLGDEADDASDLAAIHDKLASTDWQFVRAVVGKDALSTLAIADAKGRLLYTTAAPDVWKTDLLQLPFIRHAIDAGSVNSMTLMSLRDPQLVATGVLGPTPRAGLAVLFTRTLTIGGVPRSLCIQILGATDLLDDIRLDDTTRLSLVALDGTTDGDVPTDRTGYQVQTVVLSDPLVANGAPIGTLVMARAATSPLALFPGARLVFALALLAALTLAATTRVRARHITEGRV
jgi:predicted Ser/Thr protein kinase